MGGEGHNYAQLIHVHIDSCISSVGGGVMITGGDVQLHGVRIADCKADEYGGGVVAVGPMATLRAVNAVVSRCSTLPRPSGIAAPGAFQSGGGLLIKEGAHVEMNSSEIVDCSVKGAGASYGGGIFIQGSVMSFEEEPQITLVHLSNVSLRNCSSEAIFPAMAPSLAGGIVVFGSGTGLVMTGGTISACVVQSQDFEARGGGVALFGGNANLAGVVNPWTQFSHATPYVSRCGSRFAPCGRRRLVRLKFSPLLTNCYGRGGLR